MRSSITKLRTLRALRLACVMGACTAGFVLGSFVIGVAPVHADELPAPEIRRVDEPSRPAVRAPVRRRAAAPGPRRVAPRATAPAPQPIRGVQPRADLPLPRTINLPDREATPRPRGVTLRERAREIVERRIAELRREASAGRLAAASGSASDTRRPSRPAARPIARIVPSPSPVPAPRAGTVPLPGPAVVRPPTRTHGAPSGDTLHRFATGSPDAAPLRRPTPAPRTTTNRVQPAPRATNAPVAPRTPVRRPHLTVPADPRPPAQAPMPVRRPANCCPGGG